MVVFTCNTCGRSLKKQQVENHYRYECRRCEAVSCMDCGKDFWGDDYVNHTQCITEQEKYQGSTPVNKGEQKQENWIKNVQKIMTDFSGNYHVKCLLQKCVGCSNLPSKKGKFFNFVKSSFHENRHDVLEEAWSFMQQAKSGSQHSLNSKSIENKEFAAALTNSGFEDDSLVNSHTVVNNEACGIDNAIKKDRMESDERDSKPQGNEEDTFINDEIHTLVIPKKKRHHHSETYEVDNEEVVTQKIKKNKKKHVAAELCNLVNECESSSNKCELAYPESDLNELESKQFPVKSRTSAKKKKKAKEYEEENLIENEVYDVDNEVVIRKAKKKKKYVDDEAGSVINDCEAPVNECKFNYNACGINNIQNGNSDFKTRASTKKKKKAKEYEETIIGNENCEVDSEVVIHKAKKKKKYLNNESCSLVNDCGTTLNECEVNDLQNEKSTFKPKSKKKKSTECEIDNLIESENIEIITKDKVDSSGFTDFVIQSIEKLKSKKRKSIPLIEAEIPLTPSEGSSKKKKRKSLKYDENESLKEKKHKKRKTSEYYESLVNVDEEIE